MIALPGACEKRKDRWSDSLRPHGLRHVSFLCPPPSPSLLKFMSIESWCYRTISSSAAPFSFYLQSFPASGLFKWVSCSHQVAKVLELQLHHQSFQWIFRIISFRIDWFDFPAVQETLKSLLQHHSLKASLLQHSAFYMAQLSHLNMTVGKAIALTIWTFVNKVMSLLLNMLSRFATAFLPRRMHLFNFMAEVTLHSDLGAKKMKSVTISSFSSSICHEVMGLDAMIFIF